MTLNWERICYKAEIPEDDVFGVVHHGHEIALYLYEGEVFATDNLCTHGHAKLSDGFFEDGEIECPLHQGRFCVKTGKALCAPITEDVKTYPVKIEQDEVYLSFGV